MNRILIVEGDPAIAGMVALALADAGHRTEVVTDEEGAVARLRGQPPDLVLLDAAVTRAAPILGRLRQQPGWEQVTVVASTTAELSADLEAELPYGADYALTRPYELDHLRLVVARLLAAGS